MVQLARFTRIRWSEPRFWFRFLGVLSVASLALTACGSSSTTATPPASTRPPSSNSSAAGTREITYQPFSAQGTIDPNLRVSKTVSGTCQADGVAGNSSYRCFVRISGNNIYDPCFAPPRGTSGPLLCPSASPADPNVVRIDVGSLPAALQGAAEERPWAVRLANGQVCVLVNAAWGGLGPFSCQSAAPGSLADCHVPVQAAPWWTIPCQSQESASSPFTNYHVDTVWS